MKLKLLVAAAVVAAAAAVPAQAGPPVTAPPSDVVLFSNPATVVGSSTLKRQSGGVWMNLHTTGLPAGHVVTVWWIIFNNPGSCQTPFACGLADLFNPLVGTSAVYGAGHVIGGSGVGNYAAYLSTDDKNNQVLFGPGLVNPLTAEIHLIVHDHASLTDLREVESKIGKEINSFGALDGEDLQFAVHPAPAP